MADNAGLVKVAFGGNKEDALIGLAGIELEVLADDLAPDRRECAPSRSPLFQSVYFSSSGRACPTRSFCASMHMSDPPELRSR